MDELTLAKALQRDATKLVNDPQRLADAIRMIADTVAPDRSGQHALSSYGEGSYEKQKLIRSQLLYIAAHVEKIEDD